MEVNQVQTVATTKPGKKNLKLLVYLLIVGALAAVAVVVIWYYNSVSSTTPVATPVTSTSSAQINSDSQLNDVDKQLDSAELDKLSTGLDQNDAVASSF